MKDTKAQFKYFTIVQWKQEQEYLRDMHKQGWRFVRVSGFGVYHFERCTPEDVVYQLDYSPEGIANKGEYVQMFLDCGWEYLQDYVGYSYFRKPAAEMNGDEEIFCDDESRLDMMKRVFKGRVIPLIAIFFLIIIPQSVMQGRLHGRLSESIQGLFIFFGVVYLVMFVVFGIQYWNYWKTIKK